MKKLIIFCAKPRMYLSEIPLLIIFVLSIYLNDSMDTFLKLYPLIIASGLGMVFAFLFIFRISVISTEEVKSMGVFSSHDRAVINKDKTLILTLHKHKKLKIALWGNDGAAPELDWLKSDNYVPMDIYLYRETAVGSKKTIKKVLKYFDVPDGAILDLISQKVEIFENDILLVTSNNRDGIFEVRIKFKETI